VLDAIRALGVTIAVDDFGTGYSSMTYLRHLPIDSIKIDQSFIARATEEGFDSTVVESLLAIGRTLQLGVVAEGVETELQLDYVRDRGCDRAQGFLLARPMPADQFDAKLRAGEWSTTPRDQAHAAPPRMDAAPMAPASIIPIDAAHLEVAPSSAR
jgi:EAL domain-containing protein (putative c-di-GMP-specific phosphodiesterase class I)